MSQLFVPGFGALPSFYRNALPAGWAVHDPPPFRSAASFEHRVDALRQALDGLSAPITLGGHSMGAALAVMVALSHPEKVKRLLLISPAGLPLTKPIRASLRDFCIQVAEGVYAPAQVAAGLAAGIIAPRRAYRLACAVRALDLREQLAEVRRRGIRCDVVGCIGDTLTSVRHCREIANLSGARYHEIAAAGGHMWMLVEPNAFPAGAIE